MKKNKYYIISNKKIKKCFDTSLTFDEFIEEKFLQPPPTPPIEDEVPEIGTHARLICGKFDASDISHPVRDGSFCINIDGTEYDITDINQGNGETIPNILADNINSIFNDSNIPAECVYNLPEQRFEFISKSKGKSSKISYLKDGIRGTDISGEGKGHLNGRSGVAIDGYENGTCGRLICGKFQFVNPEATHGCFKISIDGIEYDVKPVNQKANKEPENLAKHINEIFEKDSIPAVCKYVTSPLHRFEFFSKKIGSGSKVSKLKKGTHNCFDMSDAGMGGLNGRHGLVVDGIDPE